MHQTSLIVTTYNRPDTLALVLTALNAQTTTNFEVIIADDGSTEKTTQCIENLRPHLSYSLHHVWQPDEGFQAAKIRNKAVAKASGEYLIFLDGDCIPPASFVKTHLTLAEKNWFVAGNRILLSQSFTTQVIESSLPLHHSSNGEWLSRWHQKKCNRMLPLLSLPLGPLRKIFPHRWKGAKTCNLSLWKKDFLAVNGFDESFIGWGYEDSDLVIRLIQQGAFRKEGRFATPVFHLWHPENDRSQVAENYQRLMERKDIQAKQGISQYL